MASYVNMSLEDIIKKKKGKPRINKPTPNGPKKQNFSGVNKVPIIDARNKIISKQRTKITDAREKLAQLAKQKDARLKLEKLRQERARTYLQNRNAFSNRGPKLIRAVPNKDRVFTDATRQVVSHPLNASKKSLPRSHSHNLRLGRFAQGRTIEKARFSGNSDVVNRPKPILRTVENDIEVIEDDPMGDEYVPQTKSTLLNRKASLQLKIVTRNNDAHENRIAMIHRTTTSDKEKSPPRPPSILKKRPMAALRSDTKAQKVEKPVMEYRIIVSNLRSSVTAGDIEELFGDVGGMMESRLVRPGTAEVIYKTQTDAERAVDLYHNRQLDGQPMNCLLVTPRSPVTTARSSSKPALYSTNSNVEPDISTFHKVLFSNL